MTPPLTNRQAASRAMWAKRRVQSLDGHSMLAPQPAVVEAGYVSGRTERGQKEQTMSPTITQYLQDIHDEGYVTASVINLDTGAQVSGFPVEISPDGGYMITRKANDDGSLFIQDGCVRSERHEGRFGIVIPARIASERSDVGYQPLSFTSMLNVTLDGVLQDDVTVADAGAGYVVRAAKDEKGDFVIGGRFHDEVVTETVHGKVEISQR